VQVEHQLRDARLHQPRRTTDEHAGDRNGRLRTDEVSGRSRVPRPAVNTRLAG
jgi:hypothetical protein